MNRRGFLSAILAAGVAPAVGHAGILMPVRKIAEPVMEIGRFEFFRFIEDSARGGYDWWGYPWDPQDRQRLHQTLNALHRAAMDNMPVARVSDRMPWVTSAQLNASWTKR